MTTRDIADTLRELYGTEVSPALVAKVTDAVWDTVQAWQGRPLEAVYPILYLDGLVIKGHQDHRVINKTMHGALGVNPAGQKEVRGLWLAETEGAKFWLTVLTERHNRGLKDVFIACVDGWTGFPEAIQTVYPRTKVNCASSIGCAIPYATSPTKTAGPSSVAEPVVAPTLGTRDHRV